MKIHHRVLFLSQNLKYGWQCTLTTNLQISAYVFVSKGGALQYRNINFLINYYTAHAFRCTIASITWTSTTLRLESQGSSQMDQRTRGTMLTNSRRFVIYVQTTKEKWYTCSACWLDVVKLLHHNCHTQVYCQSWVKFYPIFSSHTQKT